MVRKISLIPEFPHERLLLHLVLLATVLCSVDTLVLQIKPLRPLYYLETQCLLRY